MVMSTTAENYLDLADPTQGGGHPINLWWHAAQPDRVHLILSDPRFTDASGHKPGLRLDFSSNPRSADYAPSNFNRAIRFLRAAGRPAPVHDAEEHPRHLRYRDGVIATVTKSGATGELTSPDAGPATSYGAVPDEAVVCAECGCYVADLDGHGNLDVHGNLAPKQ
jgi:hypothetical protein